MNNERKISPFLIIIILLVIFGMFFNDDKTPIKKYNSNTFRLISSSENKVLESDLQKVAKKNKIKLAIDYADTLDIMDILNSGEEYDAVWSSNSIWLYQVDSKKANIINSKSLSINPVIFAIKKSKAEELGFVNKDVYTKDIVNAIKDGKLKFSMPNPISTNSGASAYFGILSVLLNNPEVMTAKMLENDNIKSELKSFFGNFGRTSGSEDFLKELYLSGEYDAIVSYESEIIELNKKNKSKDPLYAIYPIDGVSISDSVFGYIDRKNETKKEEFEKLQNYLLSKDGQKLLESNGRRTWYGGVNKNAPKEIFNPEWGIDTTKYITPIKYPSKDVMSLALNMYQMELRKPVHVVFCLDYSGSMYGSGIEELRNAMEFILVKENAQKSYIQFSKDDKIDVIPFNDKTDTKWQVESGADTSELLRKINNYSPTGSTALYPAVEEALKLVSETDREKYNVSIVLMTDGEGNVGSYKNLSNEYSKIGKNTPVYSITFGYADEKQLNEIAKLTNGKVFDGKKDLVQAFKKVRGYN